MNFPHGSVDQHMSSQPCLSLTRKQLRHVRSDVYRGVSHQEERIDKRSTSSKDTTNDPDTDRERRHVRVIRGIDDCPDFRVWRVLGRQYSLHLHLVNEFLMLLGSSHHVGIAQEVAHPGQCGSGEILIVFVKSHDMGDDLRGPFQTEFSDLAFHRQHLFLGDIEIPDQSAKAVNPKNSPPDVGLFRGTELVSVTEAKLRWCDRHILLICLVVNLVIVNRASRWSNVVTHRGG